jgi:type I restriction enzyme, S subunit
MKYEHLPEGWRLTRLGAVLDKIVDNETVEDNKWYQLIGVRLHAKGLRKQNEPILGKNISTKTLYRIRKNRIVYNKMWASKGTFAVVGDNYDGFYATSEYPQFSPKDDLILLEYLYWVVSQSTFWQQADVMSHGTTDRARLNPDDFLAMTIPMPPIDEQQRIAEVLRDTDANIVKIEDAIAAAEQTRKGFLERFISELEKVPPTRVNKALARVKREVEVDPKQLYYQIGIRSHGKGIFHKEPIAGKELGNKRIYWIEPGDFVLNIVFAWEGAVALVSEHERGMCGSHRFPTFKFNADICLPEFSRRSRTKQDFESRRLLETQNSITGLGSAARDCCLAANAQ